MHIAFVQNAQHDIHRDQRGQNQPRLLRQSALQQLSRAQKTHLDLICGQAYTRHSVVNRAGRLLQRYTRRQAERYSVGRKQALVLHA